MTVTAIRATSAPRAGRRFEPVEELGLEKDAVSACASLPGAHRGVLVIREMTGPLGIPDFTAVVGGRTLLEARLASEVPAITNRVDAGIVGACPAGVARTTDALAATLRWPTNLIERRVESLVERRALREVRPGRYVRAAEVGNIGRIYAVETKVRDHGAALRQARTYGSWADAYVLVMGSVSPVPLAELWERVATDGGGLMVAGVWKRRPTLTKHEHSRRLWAAEHVVAAMRGPTTTLR